MSREAQISAPVAKSTKDLLDRYVRATGRKKGHLVEQALLHHLAALDALPADIVIAPRIVVDTGSTTALLRSLDAPPTDELRRLMADGADPPAAEAPRRRRAAAASGAKRRRG